MGTKVKVKNGPSILELEEVVIGSQLRIALLCERQISEDPDVFEPLDFDTLEIQADIKDKLKDVDVDASFICTPRGNLPEDAGWVDLMLDGTVSGTLLEKIYEASVKVWPVGEPEHGDTLTIITMPLKYRATR